LNQRITLQTFPTYFSSNLLINRGFQHKSLHHSNQQEVVKAQYSSSSSTMAPLKNSFVTSLVIALTFTSFFTSLSAHRHLLQSTPVTQPPALTFPPLPKTTMPPVPSLPTPGQQTLPQPQPTLPQPTGLPPMPSTQIPSLPNQVQPTIPNIPQINFPSNFPFNFPFNIPFLTPPPSK